MADGLAGANVALDLLEHRPHATRQRIGRELGQRRIDGDAGAQLQLQLIEERDEIARRQGLPGEPPARPHRFHAHRPEIFRAQRRAELRGVRRFVPERMAPAERVYHCGGECGHVRNAAALACRRAAV